MDVSHIALLAGLRMAPDEVSRYTADLDGTVSVIDQISQLDVAGTHPTYQVTGLTNVTRDDEIDPSRTLTQSAVLSQAAESYQGYFVVPSVFHES